MNEPTLSDCTAVIHAAGGLVWRTGAAGRELAVIRRTRHGEEWALPKGKLRRGESWEDAAVREVNEETGCMVQRGPFAGGQIYEAAGQPKVVLYWHMRVIHAGTPSDHDEVRELCWLAPDAAQSRLTHPSERKLVADALCTAP